MKRHRSRHPGSSGTKWAGLASYYDGMRALTGYMADTAGAMQLALATVTASHTATFARR